MGKAKRGGAVRAAVHPEPAPAKERPDRWPALLPWAGAALLIVQGAAMLMVWSDDPAQMGPLVSTVPLLFVAGKEAAIPTGIAFGAEPGMVAFSMIVVDVGVNFFLLPLVHIMMDSLEDPAGALGRRMPFVGKMMRGAVRRAARHRRLVDRWGVAGLFGYAIIPFAFNGPPIVAAMGRLAGLRTRQVAPVIVAAIITTTAFWAIIYQVGFTALENVNKWIPLGLALTIMAVMIGVAVVGALRDRGEDGAGPAPGEPRDPPA